MRARNSAVLARSWSSESFCISGSSALMAATRGCKRLISRSFLVPKTLPNKVLIKKRNLRSEEEAEVTLEAESVIASAPVREAASVAV